MQAVLNLVNNIEVKIFSNKSCSNSDHVFSAKFKSPKLYSINNLHILNLWIRPLIYYHRQRYNGPLKSINSN